MSDLFFNIRIGNYHYQLTSRWKFSRSFNEHHIDNPKRFEIYQDLESALVNNRLMPKRG